MKQKYLSAKKREVTRREKEFQIKQKQRQELIQDGPKFTGGGFNLKQQPVLA